jgi:hypothetical protein
MQDVSDKLLGQFVDCLEQRLSAGSADADQDAGPASAPSGAAAVATDEVDQDAGPASAPGLQPGDVVASDPPLRTVTDLPATTGRHAASDADDALDLGATVLPVLLRQAGGGRRPRPPRPGRRRPAPPPPLTRTKSHTCTHEVARLHSRRTTPAPAR